jgi:predicted dehydrogenase
VISVAIVGCGKIADQHMQAIRRIPTSRVVAVCDREPLMAGQLAQRFNIEGRFSDLGELLRSVKPDVVHVTTPPQSHHAIGSQCLEAGSHVYIEKPFTVTATEAQALVDLARSRSLSVTAGHNCQFTPEMIEMRRLIEEGFLGGAPIHLESSWPYDLGDRSYLGPMLGDPQHWVRRLPGQLFHNILSHGVARLAEFLDDDIVQLMTMAHQSQALQQMGGQEVRDELRAMMRDGKRRTAYFCFSTQIKPGSNVFRVHGPVNSITVDLNSGSVLRHEGRNHKSYLTFVMPPLLGAKAQLANAGRNALAIARMQLHQDAGMKALIERFHRSIATRGEPPIPYREVLLTARIMDMMFEQIQGQALELDRAKPYGA